MPECDADRTTLERRDFLTQSLATLPVPILATGAAAHEKLLTVVDDFNRPDSSYHGDGWESLNPGYWRIEDHALRRVVPPSPSRHPYGMIWRRDWRLTGNFRIVVEAVVKKLGKPWEAVGDDLFGICFGGASLFESWHGGGAPGDACWCAAWRDDKTFGIYDHAHDKPTVARTGAEKPGPTLTAGTALIMELAVSGDDPDKANLSARLSAKDQTIEVTLADVPRKKFTEGHFGLVGRGMPSIAVTKVAIDPGANKPIACALSDLIVAYPLVDSLRVEKGIWKARFVALFRSEGKSAVIRMAPAEPSREHWRSVPEAGSAAIVTNDFRQSTALIDVELPRSPAEGECYFTVWKDGADVTGDSRPGAPSSYVGRLPKLAPPYRICGLSGNAASCWQAKSITPDFPWTNSASKDLWSMVGEKPPRPNEGLFQSAWVRDQVTRRAFQHFDAFGFQLLLWEDGAWRLDRPISPVTTADAYRQIACSLGGRQVRRLLMRHWNAFSPGGAEFGSGSAKGAEQFAARNVEELSPNRESLRRNLHIVQHLATGADEPDRDENPRRWRRWKSPGEDLSLILCDARLWRSTSDVEMWATAGWNERAANGRRNPTRAILGEEQFAWLEQTIRTDSSPLIVVAGMKALHPIWSGNDREQKPDRARYDEHDPAASDDAGWSTAAAERVLDLLSSRDGVVTVYGGANAGCILRGRRHQLIEACFGPIAEWGGRSPKTGFGPRMNDWDDRPVDVLAYYHHYYRTPDLKALRSETAYWNLLELQADPRGATPRFLLKLRNVIDAPADAARGGGWIDAPAQFLGRPLDSRLPALSTIPNANVLFLTSEGRPIRGARSLADGRIPVRGLVGVAPGTRIVVIAHNDAQALTSLATTLPLA